MRQIVKSLKPMPLQKCVMYRSEASLKDLGAAEQLRTIPLCRSVKVHEFCSTGRHEWKEASLRQTGASGELTCRNLPAPRPAPSNFRNNHRCRHPPARLSNRQVLGGLPRPTVAGASAGRQMPTCPGLRQVPPAEAPRQLLSAADLSVN